MIYKATWLAIGLLLGGLCGCKSDVKYYCDEGKPCLPNYPDRPYCDLTGEYEPDGVSNTCVATHSTQAVSTAAYPPTERTIPTRRTRAFRIR